MRRGALLDFILTNEEGLIEDVKVKGSLGCYDHDKVECMILRGGSQAKSKMRALDFRRTDCDLFRNLLRRVPWYKALEGRGVQESWIVFKNLLHSREVHPNMQEASQKCQDTCVLEQGAPGKTPT